MPLTYAQYVTTMATMLAVQEADSAFTAILPSVIADAEQRLYRELDLLSTIVRDTGATLTANSRNFVLPSNQGRFVTVQGVNVLSSGVRVAQLEPVSLEFLDAAWPAETATAASVVPQYFAMLTDQQIVVAPAPGASWPVEVVGTIRPTPLSASNTTSYLSLYLPDLFIAASMVFGAGYQKNFGAASDDPGMAMSWEKHYQTLFVSANIEEHRKKWQSVSWTSKSPSPVAIPQRG